MRKLKITNKMWKRFWAMLLVVAIMAGVVYHEGNNNKSYAVDYKSETIIHLHSDNGTLKVSNFYLLDKETKTDNLMWLTTYENGKANSYEPVYCLEHGKHFRSDKSLSMTDGFDNYTVKNNTSNVTSKLSKTQKTYLAYVLHYGYNSEGTTKAKAFGGATVANGNIESTQYMATQILLWMFISDIKNNTSYVLGEGAKNYTITKKDNLYKTVNAVAAAIPSSTVERTFTIEELKKTVEYANSKTAVKMSYGNYFIQYFYWLKDKVWQAVYRKTPSFTIEYQNKDNDITTRKVVVEEAKANAITLNWNADNNRYEAKLTDTSISSIEHYFTNSTTPVGVATLGGNSSNLGKIKFYKAGNQITIYAEVPLVGSSALLLSSELVEDELHGTDAAGSILDFGVNSYQKVAKNKFAPDPVEAVIGVKAGLSTIPVEVIKKDSKTLKPVAGAKYEIRQYSKATGKYTKIEGDGVTNPATTDANGKASFGKIAITSDNMGAFQVFEVSAPNGYVAQNNVRIWSSWSKKLTPSTTVETIEHKETPVRAQVNVIKNAKYLSTFSTTNGFGYGTAAKGVNGVEIGLYTDAACTKLVTKDYEGNAITNPCTTDTTGKISFGNLKPAVYYLKEVSAGKPWRMSTEVQKLDLTVNTNGNANEFIVKDATITNTLKKTNIKLYKKDAETNKPVAGARYNLIAGADIYGWNGKSSVVIAKKGTVIATATTDADGAIEYKNLPMYDSLLHQISYEVKETTAVANTQATHYVIDNKTYPIVMTDEGAKALTVKETPIKGKLTIIKNGIYVTSFNATTKKFTYNTKENLAGVEFEVKAAEKIMKADGVTVAYEKDAVVKSSRANGNWVTDSKGKIVIDGLYAGKYKVTEKVTNADFILDATPKEVELTVKLPNASLTVDNTPKDYVLEVIKEEEGTHKVIPNTEFIIYNKEPIVMATGTLAANTAITNKLLTDANGTITVKGLPKGSYYAKETKSAAGFALEADKKFEFVIADSTNKAITLKSVVENTQVKVDIVVEKESKEVSSIKDGKFVFDGTKKLEGATFSLYAETSIKDGFGTEIYEKDALIDTKTTDTNGIIKFENLYTGKYYITEVSVDNDYVLDASKVSIDATTKDAKVKHFEVKKKITNNHKTGVVLVHKVDADTLQPLEGAVFGIYSNVDIKDVNGKVIIAKDKLITTKTSDKNGEAKFDGLPRGDYYIKETKAPESYRRVSTKVNIENFVYETANEVEVKNPKAYTKLSVVKTAKNIKLSKKADGSNNGFVELGEVKLDGVEFKVVAAQDILDPADNTTVLYESGDIVEVITTDATGVAKTEDLLPATYLVQEISNKYKEFKVDDTAYTVDLSYINDTTIPTKEIEITNERYETSIEVVKKDDYSKKPLKDAEYTIYANETIRDTSGNILAKKDDALQTLTTSEDGKVNFKNLPRYDYYIKETKAPAGYNISSVKYEVSADALYNGTVELGTISVPLAGIDENENLDSTDGHGEITAVGNDNIGMSVTDTPITVGISKTDIVTGEVVEGCKLAIYKADGTPYKQFTTTSSETIFTAMPAGNYVLKETMAVTGYAKAEPVKFTVKQIGGIQHIEMKEPRATAIAVVTKLDEVTKEPVADCVFEVLDKDFNKIGEIKTGKDGKASTNSLEKFIYDDYGKVISATQYYLREIECPKHLVDNRPFEVAFEDEELVLQEQVLKEYEIYNYPITDVELLKKDADGNKLEGAKFIISLDGVPVAEVVSDKNGVATFRDAMIDKTYTYTEIEAPEGYALDTNTYSFVAHADETVEGVLEVIDPPATIAISKVDTDTLEPLEGAVFGLFDMDGNELERQTTDADGYCEFVGVKWATYQLMEVDAPPEYDLSGEVKVITVTKNYVNAGNILMKNTKHQTGVDSIEQPTSLNEQIKRLTVMAIALFATLIFVVVTPLFFRKKKYR